ncbi:DUF1254 domain-containing protein [Lentzea sp. NPDC058436]|uniref:DUF1254 domain-containing protein n=1 Tax=Lentzea sp. NPDC058436 TaxID=3346499 RepID=UPI00366A33BB
MIIALAVATAASLVSPSTAVSADQAALNAYLYTYPLVSVEVTKRSSGVPANQLSHMPVVPDASFTGVVRPNVDTLYTSMFFDASAGPVVVTVPDMGERYHLFQLMDAWTNVEGSPGTRTIDSSGYRFAIAGPDWHGSLPDGTHLYRMPTDAGWMLGRIQLNGTDDLPAVRALQQQISVESPAVAQPRETVPEVISGLTAQQYWDLYYASASHDQPRPQDRKFLREMKRHGWSPDRPVDLAKMPDAWESAWPRALAALDTDLGVTPVNGWSVILDGIGEYGTDYRNRAIFARHLLAANLPEDAVYPSTEVDAEGRQLVGENTYVLHFPAGQLPPANAFWSLTAYNAQGYLIDNPVDRYAVRGEQLARNADGSVDIHLRPTPPQTESNWLPTPASGEFSLMLRLYWPGQEVLDGNWHPPAVQRAGD